MALEGSHDYYSMLVMDSNGSLVTFIHSYSYSSSQRVITRSEDTVVTDVYVVPNNFSGRLSYLGHLNTVVFQNQFEIAYLFDPSSPELSPTMFTTGCSIPDYNYY